MSRLRENFVSCFTRVFVSLPFASRPELASRLQAPQARVERELFVSFMTRKTAASRQTWFSRLFFVSKRV